MRPLCIVSVLVVSLLSAPASAQVVTPENPSLTTDDSANEKLLAEGIALLRGRKPEEAISGYFDRVIASYEARHRDSSGLVYGARSQAEVLFYLIQAATERKSAVAIGSTWGDALYLKAYALVEVRRLDEAKEALRQALRLSPKNAQYQSELGQIYSYEKNWNKAMEAYQLAASAAEEFSPPVMKISEVTRAWRGMAYVDVELGRLVEAEELYKKCLALNPADRAASGELGLVQSLRAQQRPKP